MVLRIVASKQLINTTPHQTTDTGYRLINPSEVTITIPPAIACATMILSKGSRWTSGSCKTPKVAVSSMGNDLIACSRLISETYFAGGIESPS